MTAREQLPNLLCSDKELDFLKRAIEEIQETTRVAKRENDYRDWQDKVGGMPSDNAERKKFWRITADW